ncbi:MAG: ATP12 family chaperone protein [Brevirhabdus sp.]
MSEWAPKRFWKDTKVGEAENGFLVLLDGRQVRTPAKAALALPSFEMAEAAVAEWDAQQDTVDPNTMPVTRSANAAIDKLSVQFDEVADLIAEYGGTDLLCYRADTPEALAARQAKAWDPMLSWAERQYGACLACTSGVMHVAQPEAAVAALKDAVFKQGKFGLTALHDLVSLTGSLVLGLAATFDEFDAEFLWSLSRIDEEWQIEQWGRDEEADEMTAQKKESFFHAHRFYRMAQGH